MHAMMKGLTPEGVLGFIFVNSIVFLQAVSINCYRAFGIILWPLSKSLYYQLQQLAMSIWGRTLPYLVQTFCPAEFVVYVDPNCGTTKEESLERDERTGAVVGLRMPVRTVVMANHQIYPDWIYLWCLAYLARAHGHVKIMLKDSLSKLPFFGSMNYWDRGMNYFEFIFMKRKLAQDKDTVVTNLTRSRKYNNPMWLLLFPEGTVISKGMRERSTAYAKKMDMQDNRFLLLPRSAGLQLCLETLGASVEYLYDVTVGYEGVGTTDIPEDVYTIRSIFGLGGAYPKHIHVYLRRFKVADLPFHDKDAFTQWVFDRYAEKDALMTHFYENNAFPGEKDAVLPIRLKESKYSWASNYLTFLPFVALMALGYQFALQMAYH